MIMQTTNCPEELIKIVIEAMNFDERINWIKNYCFDQNNNKDVCVNSKLEQWCQIVAEGNWEKFKKRLEWDGLDLNQISSLFCCQGLNDKIEIPAWVENFNDAIKAIDEEKSKQWDDRKNYFNSNTFLHPQEPIIFEEIFLSFIYSARQNLKNQAQNQYNLLSSVVHDTLERTLLVLLTGICAPCLQFEFSIYRAKNTSTFDRVFLRKNAAFSNEYYQKFVNELLEGKLLSFFQEYPVLARLIGTVINFWVDSTKEFLFRLEADWDEINHTFQSKNELGQVIAIKNKLSDRHNNGRSVMQVEFTSGLKIVYKPKNIKTEKVYTNLLYWINQRGMTPKFKILKMIDRTSYGWVEFAEFAPCKNEEEIERYYCRTGMQLCLAHVLGATDLHSGNLIACGEYPTLIDLETLMQPQMQKLPALKTDNEAIALAMQHIGESVIRTLLLPEWRFDRISEPQDVSGLGRFNEQDAFIQAPEWLNINTDAMLVRNKNLKIRSNDKNIPFKNGISVPLDNYHDKIINGFRQMYYFLIENREAILNSNSPLLEFKSLQIRFVFRNTRFYSCLLDTTLYPKYMRNGLERSFYLDFLSQAFLTLDIKPYFWEMIKVERQSLEQMDIPLFTAYSNSNNLTIGDDKVVENIFVEPSFDSMISRLNQLNKEDLQQQLSFIRGSLYSRTIQNAHFNTYSLSDTLPLSSNIISKLNKTELQIEAIAIAENLQKHGVFGNDNEVTWIAPQYIPNAKKFQLMPMGYNLFDGTCGVAFFLAAMEKVTGIYEFRDLALRALQSLRQDLKNSKFDKILAENGIGGAVGCGSYIYALVCISQFLKEPVLLEDATQIASLITYDIIADDDKFDIILGSAGTILGLLALYKLSGEQKILEKAIACGYHLLNNRVTSDSGYKTWQTLDRKLLLTGFSHGAAGIAYALLRCYQSTNEIAFFDAAQEAIAYENSVFITEVGNWPDFHSPQTAPMCAWCHGAPGIGLARIAGLDVLDTAEIRQNIEFSINTTKQYKLTNLDNVCCGNLGRIEFLFYAGQKLARPQLIDIAEQQTAQVFANAAQRNHFGYGLSLTFHPGFFKGVSGIGYECLRLAYPNQLPSVLLWE